MDEVARTKERAYMLELLNDYDKKSVREFLMHSEIRVQVREIGFPPKVRRTFRMLVDPYVYKKYYHLVSHFSQEIADLFSKIRQVRLHEVKAAPDLQKFQILQNQVVDVITPWEEINNAQKDMLGAFRTATKTIDYQNIGNSARTIMLNLSQIVFDPSKHIAEGVDLSESRFKNRLHTYIKCELGTDQQEELRKYIEAIVTSTERGIDLMNKVTHDIKTNSFYAESCVIGVVTTIGLIKLIHAYPKT